MRDESSGADVLNKWFRRHRPDAIIGNNPDYEIGWLRKNRLRVPADIIYASLDQKPGARFSGIRQSWAGIFTTAIGQLAGELARHEFGLPETPRTTLVEGERVEAGGVLGVAHAASAAAAVELVRAVEIGDEAPVARGLIVERV